MTEQPTSMTNGIEILVGRSIAFDILLRALYAEWAQTKSDPQQALFSRIEWLIHTMWESEGPKDRIDAIIFEQAETTLRHFHDSVKIRLDAEAAGS